MRPGWTRVLGVAALGWGMALAAGCDCKALQQENTDLKKTLEDLTAREAQLKREMARLDEAQKATESKLAPSQERARKDAETIAALQKSLDDCQKKLAKASPQTAAAAPKPAFKPAPIQIPGVEVYPEEGRIRLVIDAKTMPGKTELAPATKETLKLVAHELNKPVWINHIVGVEGHTDIDPLVKSKKLYRDNHDLSVQRARQVFDFLSETGNVSLERLFLAGYGPILPLRPNITKEDKARNRRVEVVIYEQTVGPAPGPAKKKP